VSNGAAEQMNTLKSKQSNVLANFKIQSHFGP